MLPRGGLLLALAHPSVPDEVGFGVHGGSPFHKRYVVARGGVDRAYGELATSALAEALASGDVWVPTSRRHRSLDELLAPSATPAVPTPARLPEVPALTADVGLARASATLDAGLLEAAHGLSGSGIVIGGDKLRFPKEPRIGLPEEEVAKRLAERLYGAVPTTRITDVLSHVARWTGFVEHFGPVSTGLPPDDERAF